MPRTSRVTCSASRWCCSPRTRPTSSPSPAPAATVPCSWCSTTSTSNPLSSPTGTRRGCSHTTRRRRTRRPAMASGRQDAYRDTGQNLADRHASAVAQAFAEPSQEQLDAINEIERDLRGLVDRMRAENPAGAGPSLSEEERAELRDAAGELRDAFHDAVLPAYQAALAALPPPRQEKYAKDAQALFAGFDEVAERADTEPRPEVLDELVSVGQAVSDLVDRMRAETPSPDVALARQIPNGVYVPGRDEPSEDVFAGAALRTFPGYFSGAPHLN